MAYGYKRAKTEAGNRNGKSRWCRREKAKRGARKGRRRQDKRACAER